MERKISTNHGPQVGTGNVSVAEDVAEVQRLLQASGLTVTMHASGTTVGRFSPLFTHPPLLIYSLTRPEGSWDNVMRVIGQAHTVVHQRGVLRVQSSMRVGTRTDKKQTAADKVKRVQDLLATDA